MATTSGTSSTSSRSSAAPGVEPPFVHDLESGRRARLWTPERVPLVLPLAGFGERALANLIDLSILVAAAFAVFLIYNTFVGDISRDVGDLSGTAFWLFVVGVVVAIVGYDVIGDVFFAGRTVGKAAMRVRVLHSTGRTPDLFVSLLRNVLRFLDYLPFGYAVGTITLFITGTRRLGDLVADTFVVTERSRRRDPRALVQAAAGDAVVVVRRAWSDADCVLALSMIERTENVDARTAQLLCAKVLAKLDRALADDAGPDQPDARKLLAAALLASFDAGVLGEIGRLVDAERALVEALAALSSGCTVDDVERADQAIRRAASELMRAQRRDVPARYLESLSLALMDAERRRIVKEPLAAAARRYLLHEVPSTVWAERWLIARAGAVLSIGLVVGGAVAYADADVARFLVGDNTAQLVERGANWTDTIEQRGSYADASVSIIFNNVFVGVSVFALGLLGGVATLLRLLANGVTIGATFGYALKLGTAGTLLRFICAHGPVELTMVCVAGAGGMCLGRAVLSPGRRTRLEALREEGARGVRLVVAASIGFMCIGTVEGFISPGRMFPTPVNATLGLTLLAMFWAWVRAFGAPSSPSSSSSSSSSSGISPAART